MKRYLGIQPGQPEPPFLVSSGGSVQHCLAWEKLQHFPPTEILYSLVCCERFNTGL